jgi:predicted acyl esterase
MRQRKNYRIPGPVHGALLSLLMLTCCLAPAQEDCDLLTERNCTFMVPMADGTRLYTRVKLPEGDGPWPTLFGPTYTPDNDLNTTIAANFARGHNFALVTQLIRGRSPSEGEMDLLYEACGWGEHQDGKDAMAWILQQPWCNGDIGVYGRSGRGQMTNLLAGTSPEGLKAEFVGYTPSDYYLGGALYDNGAWRENITRNWFGKYGTSLQHALAHPVYDDFWRGMSIDTRQETRDHPVLILAGWYDIFLKSTLQNYMTLRQYGGPIARAESKLVIVVKGHAYPADWSQQPFPAAGLAVPHDYGYTELFDHFLNGYNNGYEELSQVTYYMMGDNDNPQGPGNEWRYADEWPPPAQEAVLYLHNDNSLQKDIQPTRGVAISYDYDPGNPVPSLGGTLYPRNEGDTIQPGTFDQRPLESRPDVLIFETEVLTNPVEIAGPILLHLFASSDCVDTDFTGKLTDVYPDGRSMIIADGIMRASFRDSLEAPSPLVPNEVYEFSFDLWHTAITFNTGHRIRLAISSSNYPKYEANPNTGTPPALNHTEIKTARNTLYLDEEHPSHLSLPIVGPDADGDTTFDFLDAFPELPSESSDDDADGMGDNFEQAIIDADPTDAFNTLAEIAPQGDFDRDGASNLLEFTQDTDPTNPCSVFPDATFHTADRDCNRAIDLSELLAVSELFNAGNFHCLDSIYTPGPGDTQCPPHASDDNPQDWRISLSELVALIQHYNTTPTALQLKTTTE